MSKVVIEVIGLRRGSSLGVGGRRPVGPRPVGAPGVVDVDVVLGVVTLAAARWRLGGRERVRDGGKIYAKVY